MMMLQRCLAGLLLFALGAAVWVRADENEDKAVAALKKWGGKVTVDAKKPGSPVIAVTLRGPNVTDAALKDLAVFKQLAFLDLGFAQVTDAGLKDIRELKNLRTLSLSGTKVTDAGLKELRELDSLLGLLLDSTAVTDVGLKEVCQIKKLGTLNLKNTKVTDAGVKDLRELKNLNYLYLDGTEVTDAGLMDLRMALQKTKITAAKIPSVDEAEEKAIAALKKWDAKVFQDEKSAGKPVTIVYLKGAKVTDAALKDLAAFKKLRVLYLDASQVSNAGLMELRACKNLQFLSLTSTKVTDAGLKELRELTGLQTLILNDTKVTDAGLQDLRELKNLKTLNLFRTQVTDAGLKDLRLALPTAKIMPQLDESEAKAIAAVEKWGGKVVRAAGSQVTAVNFYGTKVTEAGLKDLRDFKSLQSLNLFGTPTTDAGLKEVSNHKNLTYLNLGRTLVTTKGIPELRTLKNLRLLDLTNTNVTNAGVKVLRDFTNLRTLILDNTPIDGNALKDLRNLKNLKELHLYGTFIGDSLIYLDLKEFRDLEVLNLGVTEITDPSLSELRFLPKLKTLTLGTDWRYDTLGITDKGLKELQGITSLQRLNLLYIKATQAGIDDLQAALPKLKIVNSTLALGRPAPSKGPPNLPKDTKPDVQFVFDFSALNFNSGNAKKDAYLRRRCDSFEKTVRDQVYPILREITGLPLGKYQKEIRYEIIPGKTVGGSAGGVTLGGNHVKYAQIYSVDADPPNDIHELIHVFNAASKTMHGRMDHIWHGALMDAVEVRLGWIPKKAPERFVADMRILAEKIKASPNEKADLATGEGRLGGQLRLFYYERGEKALGRLYRCTMNPRPVEKPSPRMVEVWGRDAVKVQSLMETLRKEYNYTFDEPTCRVWGF